MFRVSGLAVPTRLFIATLFFGTGWFSLSFTFPLLAQDIGYSYVIIGVLGFAAALPFPIVAFLYTRSDYRMIRYGTYVPLIALTILSALFFVFYRAYFIPLTLIASITQAPWWIATEIAIGSLSGQRNAEKYSAGWGIPNAIAPVVMGVILEAKGYSPVFLIAMVSFIAALAFNPRPGNFREQEHREPLKKLFLFSLFFAGLFSGFIYFVMEPLLKFNNFSYVTIGALASLYGFVAAIGYIILNYTKDLKISTYSAISALLIFPASLFGLVLNLYSVAFVVVLAGFGVSISMSKVLSYISSSSDTKRGVFFYETFFGLGFMAGSLGQDVLFQFFGRITIGIVFLVPLAYAIILILNGSRPAINLVS